MNKCLGCGATLQNIDVNEAGYSKEIYEDTALCMRCFRIKNYGDYKLVNKSNEEFIEILKSINKTNDLVLLVVDIFDINKKLDLIKEHLKNDILLVITKRDILPKVVNNNKLLNYFDQYNLNLLDKVLISTNKNYNFDLLLGLIKKYKKSKNVYVVGFTNAGKSSMINKIIKNYSSSKYELTTSMLPSTTLSSLTIKIDDNLSLIDTPGILDEGNIINYIEPDKIKKIMPKNGIKPVTYQAKGLNTITIEDLASIEVTDNNLTFYMSNALNLNRHYRQLENRYELVKHELEVKQGEDIVIQGLGFIRVAMRDKITVYAKENVAVYTRKSLI